jgi:hypothetical protein
MGIYVRVNYNDCYPRRICRILQYSMDSFLVAFRPFMCLNGTPSRVQSDKREQPVATSKHFQWDCTVGWEERDRMEFIFHSGVNPSAGRLNK